MLEIRQWETYVGEDWWKWAVWLEGDVADLDAVQFVEWALHPTFRNPVRKVDDRLNKFRLETAGWGVFPIIARVQMKDGTQKALRHYLELHYLDGTKNDN